MRRTRFAPAARNAAAATAALLIAGLLAACTSGSPGPESTAGAAVASAAPVAEAGIQKIKHVVIIMQENRSFDSFFGTYPGADGIPAENGQFTVCVPDPRSGGCDKPYHDPSPVNGGASHSLAAAQLDIGGGKMNGFGEVRPRRSPGVGCGAITNPPTQVRLDVRYARRDGVTTMPARSRTTGRTRATSH